MKLEERTFGTPCTLKSNLKPVLPSHEAFTKKDDQPQTAKRQYFDKRREVRPLPDLQPGDSARVKLDQQKGRKMSGKVIARSPTPRSYVIQTPFRKVRRNCRHLRTTISTDKVEMPDEQDLDLEAASQAKLPSSGSSHTVSGEPPQTGASQGDVNCTHFCKHTA